MNSTSTFFATMALAACTSCAFHSEPLPLPATFYAMETAIDDSTRQEAFLGLEVELNASDDMFSLDVPPGVRVIEVEPSSPAEVAGLAVGDILLKFDGRATDDPQRLTKLLEGITEAADVELEFQRGSKVMAVAAKLTMRSTSATRYLYHVDRGLLRGAFRDNAEGFPEVVALDVESPLHEAGLGEGDVILQFQGEDPGSAGEFLRRVRLGVRPGDAMAMLVLAANGKKRSIEVDAWSPGSVMTEAGIWPLFNWRREIGEDRGEFAIGTLLITDLFRYRRDGNESYYSILSLITWETGELILEETAMPPELNP